MVNTRIQLHELLVELFGNNTVYYRPPENIKMKYPCIRYHRDDIIIERANNISYRKTNRYQLTVIDSKPDNSVIDKLLELPMCAYERHYISDNLNHDVLVIYY